MQTQYSQRAQTSRHKHAGIGAARRLRILQRYNFHCQYCGDTANSVDHIVPWTYGGTDNDDNLVAACHICNLIAGNKVFDSIDLKRVYIMERRHVREERGRDRMRSRIATCPCGDMFQPRVDGATNVLCATCAVRDENRYR